MINSAAFKNITECLLDQGCNSHQTMDPAVVGHSNLNDFPTTAQECLPAVGASAAFSTQQPENGSRSTGVELVKDTQSHM